mgnify:CR=1 FL=1
MNNSKLTKWVRSTAIATIATSLMLAVLIVVAEEIPDLKNWLKATFYHHWLGKSALAISLFIVTSLVLTLIKRDKPQLSTIILVETIAVILAVLTIAGFFLLHTLKIV